MTRRRHAYRQDHGKAFHPPHIGGFEVADPDEDPATHFLDWDVLDEPADDRPRFGLAEVDLFNVQTVGVRMFIDCRVRAMSIAAKCKEASDVLSMIFPTRMSIMEGTGGPSAGAAPPFLPPPASPLAFPPSAAAALSLPFFSFLPWAGGPGSSSTAAPPAAAFTAAAAGGAAAASPPTGFLGFFSFFSMADFRST